MREKLAERIKKEEGLKLKPYRCTSGKLTIGYGRNLEGKGISNLEAEVMFDRDLLDAEVDAKEFCGNYWISLNEVRKAVIIEMSFVMGIVGLMKWKGLYRAIAKGDWMLAGESLRNSKWYRSEAVLRVEELIKMLETGRWQT